METNNTKSNIQKKMFVYARDFALDKLNKKLEEKIVKQQIRRSNSQKQYEDVSYQRCSQDSDLIRTSSEYTSSSSQGTPLVQSNDKLAGNTNITESIGKHNTQQSLTKDSDVERSAVSLDSGGQDDDFLTADEDEEPPIRTDGKRTDSKSNQPSIKPKNNDIVLEIDDKNDKLIVKPTLPHGQAPPVPHTHGSSPVDYSGYIQKKSLAQGMMDLALVSANTNQLRYIIEYKDHHPYFLTSLSLVIASLFLQLAVGMTLIWNTRFNVKKRKEMQEADKVNNFSVIGIFVVTLINVFLSTFGGAPQGGGSGGDSIFTTTSPDETTDATLIPIDSEIVYH